MPTAHTKVVTTHYLTMKLIFSILLAGAFAPRSLASPPPQYGKQAACPAGTSDSTYPDMLFTELQQTSASLDFAMRRNCHP